MTQPQRLTIPQGLNPRRSMPWGIRVLVAGLSLGAIGATGYIAATFMELSAAIDGEFPASRRHQVAERMKSVSQLLKETVLLTECPVLPSAIDGVRKKGKILKAQFGQHHGVIVPYVSYRALLRTRSTLANVFRSMIADVIVQYRFTSDEQLDLFLDGVAFFVGEENDVHGVRDASYALLGKAPDKLTPSEVALLASAINYPRPFPVDGDGIPTREGVLHKMHDEGLISASELEVALRELTREDDERVPAALGD